MTPELKTACEVIFQEHKGTSQPIKWNSYPFRGRISLGLSDLAKETLTKKNIIIFPKKSKKIITLLNPAVASASSFEEAEDIINNKRQVVKVESSPNEPLYASQQVLNGSISQPKGEFHPVSIAGKPEAPSSQLKWYMRPLFYYFIWPLCAAIAGAVISYLLDFAYTELFLDWK